MNCSQHEFNNGNNKLKKTIAYGNNGNSKRSAIIGGCFNALHLGHKEYIKLAFDFADEVFVLLSTDKYAKICKSYEVDSYEYRKKCLENYINEINGFKSYTIYELDSECSLIQFCLEKDITMALIVPEYYSLFEKINCRVDALSDWFFHNSRKSETFVDIPFLVRISSKTERIVFLGKRWGIEFLKASIPCKVWLNNP